MTGVLISSDLGLHRNILFRAKGGTVLSLRISTLGEKCIVIPQAEALHLLDLIRLTKSIKRKLFVLDL